VTILPRTRSEDAQFRERLIAEGDELAWEHLYDVTNEQDEVVDRLRVCCDSGVSAEGFRLLWFHSTRKVARDMATRAHAIERTQQELTKLRERLQLPRTRFRDQEKVQKAVEEILDRRGTSVSSNKKKHSSRASGADQDQTLSIFASFRHAIACRS